MQRSRGEAMHARSGGFTLLELLTVVVIVALLASMLFPVAQSLKSKAEKARCAANLRSLYVGAATYLQHHQQWPQISPSLIKTKGYARQWIAALEPYGIGRSTWICPTIQRASHNGEKNDPKTPRVDYLATPFDQHEMTPYRWTWQPWFIERGDVHGRGNLIIFPDGKVEELRDFVQKYR